MSINRTWRGGNLWVPNLILLRADLMTSSTATKRSHPQRQKVFLFALRGELPLYEEKYGVLNGRRTPFPNGLMSSRNYGKLDCGASVNRQGEIERAGKTGQFKPFKAHNMQEGKICQAPPPQYKEH